MLTRKEKREQEKDINYFFELEKVRKHLFKNLDNKLNEINDPRHQSYVTYNSDILLMMTIFKNAFDLKSMRSMTDQFNKDECIHNFQKLLGCNELKELPHYDTINDFLSRLKPRSEEHTSELKSRGQLVCSLLL